MASASTPAMSNTTLLENNVETVWSMAFSQLERGSSEIVLPAKVAGNLGEAGVRAVGERYSSFLSAQCSVMVDHASNTLRLVPPTGYEEPASSQHLPAMTTNPTTTISLQGPMGSKFLSSSPADVHSNLPNSAKIGRNKTAKVAKARAEKIPRPANAFIVYRQEWHRKLKAEDSSIPNNDISKIVGKKWGDEPESVRAEYRKRAQQIKEKHEREHPGYQYRPRKQTEKKKRAAKKNLQLKVSVPKLNESDMVPEFETNADGTLTHKFEPGQTGFLDQKVEQFNNSVGNVTVPYLVRSQINVTDSEESRLDWEYADANIDHAGLERKESEKSTHVDNLRQAHANQNPPLPPPNSLQGWIQFMQNDLRRFAGVHNNTLAPAGTLDVNTFFNDPNATRYVDPPMNESTTDGQSTTVNPLDTINLPEEHMTNNMFEMDQLRSVFPGQSDSELIHMMGMDDSNVNRENAFVDDNVDWHEWLNMDGE